MKKLLLTLALLLTPSITLAANITVPQSTAYGQVLIGNQSGGNYTPVATSTLNVTAASILGLIAQGANVTITGNGTPASPYTISASSGGGSLSPWATTTSQTSSYINYSLNNTDIVTVGGNSTSSANFIFDPNSQIGYFSGLVGIGTKSPSASLSITGSGVTNPFLIASSSGNTMLTVLANGNVGIGTTSPTEKLSVVGNINVAADFSSLGSESYPEPFDSSNTHWYVYDDLTFVGSVPTYLATGTGDGGFGLNDSADLVIPMVQGASYRFEWTLSNATAGDLVCQLNGDNLFGTLPIVNGTNHFDFTFSGNLPPEVDCSGTTGGFEVVSVSLKEAPGGNITAGNITTEGNGYFNGNVGIGTSSPNGKLEIRDSSPEGTVSEALAIYKDNDSSNYNIGLHDIVWENANPGSFAKEWLGSDGQFGFESPMDMSFSGGGVGAPGNVSFTAGSGNDDNENGGSISYQTGNGGGDSGNGGDMNFTTGTGSGMGSNGNFIFSNGLVGIGTNSPNFPLEIYGDASSSGTIYATNFYDTSFNGSTCVGETGGLLGTSNCVSSIAQTYGTAQTGNITFATSSDTNIQLTITNTAGAFTFTPVWAGTLADNRITSSGNWNTAYTDRITSTSFPLQISSNVLSWIGLATSTNLTQGRLLYATGVNTIGQVATSTLSASSPLTGSFTQVGSGGSLGCQTASGSQAGCLSSADWTTFNNKQASGAYLTAVTADAPLSGSGTPASPLIFTNPGYISTAILSLDGLSGTSQTFATTSNAGGWGFSAATTIHTLNIPRQDGTQVLGLLNSADWNTFNGKQPAGSYLTSVTADSPLSGAGTSGSHLIFTNPGYITANQTITLSGAVTGSGATSIATTFGNVSQGVLSNINAVSQAPSSNATSTLFTGSTGQVDYFASSGGLQGTSSLQILTSQVTQANNILVTGSSTLQNFTFVNATGTSATTTSFAILGLKIAKGSFLAVDGNGSVIATSTPSGSGVTSVTGSFPIVSSGGTTPNITFGGLGTSTNLTNGQVPYVTGVNTFGQVATGTIAQGTGITVTGTGYDLGAGITIALTSNTISGVALGGTLAALTATNASLTFSGSYTGTAVQTVGLNVGNANTWTALQTFSAIPTSAVFSYNVGYGTTTPWSILSVSTTTAATGAAGLQVNPFFTVASSTTGIAATTEILKVDQFQHIVTGTGNRPTLSAGTSYTI